MMRVNSEHGVATTMMEQIYVGGMIMNGEMYVISSTKMEGVTRRTQCHG